MVGVVLVMVIIMVVLLVVMVQASATGTCPLKQKASCVSPFFIV
jgi:hypothetical protein